LKKTGDSDHGGVIFEVDNWTSDPKIWPHDKMYGVYQMSYGEQGIFNFLELAFSDEPIDSLEDGLKGRYFIGMNCMDHKVCNFAKAAPVPPHMRISDYTPAREMFFL